MSTGLLSNLVFTVITGFTTPVRTCEIYDSLPCNFSGTLNACSSRYEANLLPASITVCMQCIQNSLLIYFPYYCFYNSILPHAPSKLFPVFLPFCLPKLVVFLHTHPMLYLLSFHFFGYLSLGFLITSSTVNFFCSLILFHVPFLILLFYLSLFLFHPSLLALSPQIL